MRARREQLVVWSALAIVIALILLALFGYLTGRWDEARSEPALCLPDEQREKVRAIMLDALDAALKDHIQHMFEVWMRDDKDQPRRAATGARQGVRAYVGARTTMQEWTPAACP